MLWTHSEDFTHISWGILVLKGCLSNPWLPCLHSLLSVEQQAVCIAASLLSSQDFWSFSPKCSCPWSDTGSALDTEAIQGLIFHFSGWGNSLGSPQTLPSRTFCTERFGLTGVGMHTLLYPKTTTGPSWIFHVVDILGISHSSAALR